MARARHKHTLPDYDDADDVRAIVIAIMGKDAVNCGVISELLCRENQEHVEFVRKYFLKYHSMTRDYIENNLWAQKLRKKYPIAFAENERRFNDAVDRIKPSSKMRLPDSFAGTLFEAIGGHCAIQKEVAERLGMNYSCLQQFTLGQRIPGPKGLEKLLGGLAREFPATVHMHPLLRIYADVENVTVQRIKSGKKPDVALLRKTAGELLKDVRESTGSDVAQVEEALTHPPHPPIVRGKVAAIEQGDLTTKRSVFTSTMLAICEVFDLKTVDPIRNNTLQMIAGIIARAPA